MSSTINEISNISNQSVEQQPINQNIQNNIGEGIVGPIPEININNTETL